MAKDYSDLIGKRFHSLTILSISEPMREERSQRLCECLCSCGQIYRTRLSKVVRGENKSCGHLKSETRTRKEDNFAKEQVQEKAYRTRTSKDKPLKSNKTTGVRNISYSQQEKQYVICLRHKKRTYKGRAKTLKEAIRLKENFIQQAERDFQETIYK